MFIFLKKSIIKIPKENSKPAKPKSKKLKVINIQLSIFIPKSNTKTYNILQSISEINNNFKKLVE